MAWSGGKCTPRSVLLPEQIGCWPLSSDGQGRAQAYLPEHPGEGRRAVKLSRLASWNHSPCHVTGMN